MSKLHKRLIVLFCFGVFLCGVGSGVAFTEFSALSYGGEYMLESTIDMKTDDIDVVFEPGENIVSICGVYQFNQYHVMIDESIPDNTVRFHTKYNARYVEPFVNWNAEEETVMYSYYHKYNRGYEMSAILEAKDIVLQNLKEGKLVAFAEPDYWEEVTVWVNSKSAQKIKIES